MSDSLTRNPHYLLGRALNVLRQVVASDSDDHLRLQALDILQAVEALGDPKSQGQQLALAADPVGDVA